MWLLSSTLAPPTDSTLLDFPLGISVVHVIHESNDNFPLTCGETSRCAVSIAALSFANNTLPRYIDAPRRPSLFRQSRGHPNIGSASRRAATEMHGN